MIDSHGLCIVCNVVQPSYNYPGLPRRYCFSCRLGGMVNKCAQVKREKRLKSSNIIRIPKGKRIKINYKTPIPIDYTCFEPQLRPELYKDVNVILDEEIIKKLVVRVDE